KAGDGRVVKRGLQNEREWKAFCDVVLRDPALATDPRFAANVRRSEHRAELKAVIEQAFSSVTAQDVIARLDEAQIANAAVNQIGDLWTHPQLH
ncbi:CoA transferase, partial [Clostridioides difficile]|nr:CoA transferase [Clostridioides difficile]